MLLMSPPAKEFPQKFIDAVPILNLCNLGLVTKALLSLNESPFAFAFGAFLRFAAPFLGRSAGCAFPDCHDSPPRFSLVQPDVLDDHSCRWTLRQVVRDKDSWADRFVVTSPCCQYPTRQGWRTTIPPGRYSSGSEPPTKNGFKFIN